MGGVWGVIPERILSCRDYLFVLEPFFLLFSLSTSENFELHIPELCSHILYLSHRLLFSPNVTNGAYLFECLVRTEYNEWYEYISLDTALPLSGD
jgi:hypothetical protein